MYACAETSRAEAAAWLAEAAVESQGDRNFKLWGLRQLGADASQIERARTLVLESQLEDGSWSQIPGMIGDAFGKQSLKDKAMEVAAAEAAKRPLTEEQKETKESWAEVTERAMPTREEMQAAADTHGVGFAKGYQVRNVEEAQRLVSNLRFPIMVKHPKRYGSTGMFRESRVDTPEQLAKQVERVCGEFGAARMEEFIVGREYNVLVVDNPDDFSQPIAYPPTELIFPPGEEFWHTVVKWDTSLPFNFKQVTDADLIPRLQDIAIRMFKAIGIMSYGRCDVRVNERGEMFILEINPNPAIMLKPEEFGPADYMILYDPGGYKLFFDRILRVAQFRHQQRLQAQRG